MPFRRASRPAPPPVGIGAVVAVMPGRGEQWCGEPTGVVVAPAGDVWGYPGTALARRWIVAFSEDAYTCDGAGPIDRADVPEVRLRLLDTGTIAEVDLPDELRE